MQSKKKTSEAEKKNSEKHEKNDFSWHILSQKDAK